MLPLKESIYSDRIRLVNLFSNFFVVVSASNEVDEGRIVKTIQLHSLHHGNDSHVGTIITRLFPVPTWESCYSHKKPNGNLSHLGYFLNPTSPPVWVFYLSFFVIFMPLNFFIHVFENKFYLERLFLQAHS